MANAKATKSNIKKMKEFINEGIAECIFRDFYQDDDGYWLIVDINYHIEGYAANNVYHEDSLEELFYAMYESEIKFGSVK